LIYLGHLIAGITRFVALAFEGVLWLGCAYVLAYAMGHFLGIL